MRHVNDRCNRLAVNALSIKPADRLLELGFGPGHGIALMAAQAPEGCIYGIDLSEVMLRQATVRNRSAVNAGRVLLQRGSCERLPFPDRSMDGVIAVNVAYFWRRADRIAAEIRRVLRPNGQLAIYVTAHSTMRIWGFANQGMHRHWDALALSHMLRTAGFPVASITVNQVQFPLGVTGLLVIAVAPSDRSSLESDTSNAPLQILTSEKLASH